MAARAVTAALHLTTDVPWATGHRPKGMSRPQGLLAVQNPFRIVVEDFAARDLVRSERPARQAASPGEKYRRSIMDGHDARQGIDGGPPWGIRRLPRSTRRRS
jgi:hypothetical protein